MRYFLRAVSMSFRYKWTLVASLLSAVMVGALWGASISAVYPFIEVVFQGTTVDQWLDERIDKAGTQIEDLSGEIAQAEAKPGAAAGPGNDLALKKDRLQAEEKALARYKKVRTWVHGRTPQTPFGTLLLVMGLLIAATILKGTCLVLNTVLASRVVNRTIMDIRRTFYRRALLMDQKRIEELGTPTLTSCFSHNVNMIAGGLRSLYGKCVREPLKMLACFIGAALISWRLLLLSMVVAPIGIYCMHSLAKRMKAAAKKEMGGWAVVLQTLMETFNGIRVVRLCRRERAERYRFKENTRMLYRMSMRMSIYDSLTSPITELMGIFVLVIAILAGAHLVLNQETHLLGIRISDRPLSMSALFVFYAMLAGISDPARKISSIYNQLVRAVAASEGLFTIFDREPEVVAQEPKQPVPQHCKNIWFRNVSYNHRPLKRVLHNVKLVIPFGQNVVFLGENGCGKSTLVSLLVRFYDPIQGDIYLDDTNLKNVNPRKLREQIGLVPQDPLLFRGTVWDNIAYGAPNASDEEIMAAARMALVDPFIDQLPSGYQTQVGEHGKFLSGGQRQRVTLARAILSNPRILILDEATSQLDLQAEQEIRESLRPFLKDRTTLMITHRQALIEVADRVIIMDGGRIVADMPAKEYLANPSENFTRDVA